MKQLLMVLTMAWLTISVHAITVTDTIFNRYEHEEFAFGADVSFVPMMESWGTKWLDKNGRQKDILQILKASKDCKDKSYHVSINRIHISHRRCHCGECHHNRRD